MSGERDRERPPAPEPLPHPVVDNHCHLDASVPDALPLPLEDVLAASADVGVPRIVQIGCDLPGARWAVEAASSYDALVAGVALHPNEAPRLPDLDAAMAEIEQLAGAHAEVLAVLDEEGAPERWVMHCFSGNARFARACLDRGAFLSFAGTVTFKNAQPVRDALTVTPLDRVLVETDAPFLTPTPYRGRPNASYLVPVTVRAMAEIRGEDLTTLCEAVDATTDVAFGGPW